MKTLLITILALCSLASAQRHEIRIDQRDTAILERYYYAYRDAASTWAVSRQRFYADRDPLLEARYAEAKMRWEHAKSDVAIKYLTVGGKLQAGWEDGAQFDWGLTRIVHADGNEFLIYLSQDMRMDWSIELYLPR